MISSSSFLRLNAVDIYKAVRGALIVLVATFVLGGLDALLTYAKEGNLCGSMMAEACSLDILRPLLISGSSFLLETARRLFTNYSR